MKKLFALGWAFLVLVPVLVFGQSPASTIYKIDYLKKEGSIGLGDMDAYHNSVVGRQVHITLRFLEHGNLSINNIKVNNKRNDIVYLDTGKISFDFLIKEDKNITVELLSGKDLVLRDEFFVYKDSQEVFIENLVPHRLNLPKHKDKFVMERTTDGHYFRIYGTESVIRTMIPTLNGLSIPVFNRFPTAGVMTVWVPSNTGSITCLVVGREPVSVPVNHFQFFVNLVVPVEIPPFAKLSLLPMNGKKALSSDIVERFSLLLESMVWEDGEWNYLAEISVSDQTYYFRLDKDRSNTMTLYVKTVSQQGYILKAFHLYSMDQGTSWWFDSDIDQDYVDLPIKKMFD